MLSQFESVSGFGLVILIPGVLLLMINLYGLTRDIRPELDPEHSLRFENDLPLPYEETQSRLKQIKAINNDLTFTSEATQFISEAMAHIHWNEEPDPDKYHQRVPVWENFILFALGYISNIPEFTKYHFIDVNRSLKRGVGICGDASMVLSQLLSERNIQHQIVAFPAHVVVEATLDNKTYFLDPDYGVLAPVSAAQVHDTPSIIDSYYHQAGYDQRESNGLQKIYQVRYTRWNGVKHFVTNKYYFEPVAYFLKWFIPFGMMSLGFVLIWLGKGS